MTAEETSVAAQILSTTESLCPVRLQRIGAERVAEGDAVYLRKSCASPDG